MSAAQERIMKVSFRLALWVFTTIAATAPASAQGWPTRPVTVVVPFAAGSSTDTAARIPAGGMSEALGQQLVVEKVGGAAGMTGTPRGAASDPVSYPTLLRTVANVAIATGLH